VRTGVFADAEISLDLGDTNPDRSADEFRPEQQRGYLNGGCRENAAVKHGEQWVDRLEPGLSADGEYNANEDEHRYDR
jgi:hypothetical protein